MGRIADIAKSNIPITWDALAGDQRVGDPILTARETYVTNLIFGTVPSDAEQDALAQIVADYAGMLVAVDVIGIAIDFWMTQSEESMTQGPREMVKYPERLESLQARKAALLVAIAKIEPQVIPLIPATFEQASSSRPLISSMDDELLTPNPQDFGPIYAEPEV